MITAHATCIAFDDLGVLLRGPSGSGKSDLALRAIAAGARLVADDRVALMRDGENLVASAPKELFGMIEIRGVGIVRMEAAETARVALVADLVEPTAVERLPEGRACEVEGVNLPWVALAPFECSAVAKLRFAALAAAEPVRMVT
jgi:HPr kinase/phosphorylase